MADAGAITRWLEANVHRFDGPAQYAGDEPGAAGKDWAGRSVRMLLCASWDYSQAAGNMAIPTVYQAVNGAGEGYLCDRFYLPATGRDLDLMKRESIPVFGIETKHQLADFDVVGTSISYSVLFMNYCQLLSMSGVPLRWKDRSADPGRWPMVLVGGQAYGGPEFMAPVVDCVWLGEAEDEPGNPGGIGEVMERIAFFKASGDWRADRVKCYAALAREFAHLYFPRFHEFSYRYEDRGLPEPTKMVSGHWPVLDGMAFPRVARKVIDMDAIKPLDEPVLLYTDPGMGSGDIEVARGCPAWCSMCKLSWATKPYRQSSVERTIANAAQVRRNMGAASLSLVAPDPPMDTLKKARIAALLEQVTGEVDDSSMRLDDYKTDDDFILLLTIAGSEALTLGLEGNSQRMRDLSGKGTSDDDVCEVVTKAIRAGIHKIKLYLITNWPGEEVTDVLRVVGLGRRLDAIRTSFGNAEKIIIQFSWTPLLLESQTPLQWFEVTAPDYTLQHALNELRDLHIDVKLGTKANPAKLAFFQACQRASREAGEALVDVIEDLDQASWGGFPRDMKDRIDAAMVARGFLNGLADIFGERYRQDLLGWEHISTGVSIDLMWDAYASMVEFLKGTDAETYDDQVGGSYRGAEWVQRCDQGCQGAKCGVCTPKDLRLRKAYIEAIEQERDLTAEPVDPVDRTSVAWKLRMKVWRPERYRFSSPEFIVHAVRRAAYRASEETGFPEIATHSVRLASDAVSYRDRSAGLDFIEFGITRRSPGPEATQAWCTVFTAELKPWLEVLAWEPYPARAKLPARPHSLWELELGGRDTPEAVNAALRAWESRESVPVLIRTDSFYAGAQQRTDDAKKHVAGFWLARDGSRLMLRMLLTGQLGPYQAYATLMSRASWIDAAARTALRVGFFRPRKDNWLAPCQGCGDPVPEDLLGIRFGEDYCPRCRDEAAGVIVSDRQPHAV